MGADKGHLAAKPRLTKQMITAGVKVLRESGALFAPGSADALVVREVVTAVLQARHPTGIKRTPESQKQANQTSVRARRCRE